MDKLASEIIFSPSTRAQQSRRGSRLMYERRDRPDGFPDQVTPDLARFVGGARSFYLATASADGQPYIQHRGGQPGFLRVIDEKTLGFADFGGNRQYITLGNLDDNPRAFIFLMDYAHQVRIKLWGWAEAVENDDALLSRLSEGAQAAPQRSILFHLEAWDRNCPQHIPQLIPIEAVEALMRDNSEKVASLEAEIAALRARGG